MVSSILTIGHRGFSGKFPENTLLSLSEAIKVGANIAETDLQLTKDEEVVLFHDRTVDRILKINNKNKNNNKTIADFTLQELKKQDFGSWLDPRFKNVRVTTLTEILEYKNKSGGNFDYILEIKGPNPDILIPKVKSLIQKYSFSFKIGYLSVRDESAYDLALKNGFERNHIAIMQKKRTPEEIITVAKQLHAKFIQLRPANWTNENWKELQESGLLYTIFYADTKEQYEFFSKLAPYGIFTNFPNRLHDFLIA